MSSNDYPKCMTKNESNIPVPKSYGRNKSKVRSQFPELQKYIETIINASNDCDSEDASDKKEKTSKVGKSGNNAMRNENKKVEKRKFNFSLNSEKVNERTKTTVSVSSRENISNQFFSDFEDPRNWEIVTTQNDFHKNLKIEKALKNLFPNPYKLLQIRELNKSKISMYIEKIVNDDVTLPDVIISKSDAQKTLGSKCVESIFEADYDKCSSQMDFGTLNFRSSVKNRRSKIRNGGKNSSFSDSFTSNATSSFFKNVASDKSNNSTSRQNSFENLKDREKNIAHESFLRYGRRRMPKNKKSSREHPVDYDIGKLKLLTMTDSDDSSKDPARDKGKNQSDDVRNRICTNESSRNDKLQFSLNGMKESGVVKEFLSELNHKHKVNQTEARNRSKSDGGERKIVAKCKSKRKNSVINFTETDDCPKIVEDDFGNYEEPNLKFLKSSDAEMKKKDSSASEGKEVKVEDESAEKASEKIDEVLQFMCDRLIKFRNEDEPISGNPMKNTDAIEDIRGHKWPKLDTPPDRKSSKSKQNLATIEREDFAHVSFHIPNNGRQNTPPLSRSEKNFQLVQFDSAVVRDPNLPDTVYPDSAAINNENAVQTVEIQNELGGYTEEQHQMQMSGRDIRLATSIFPLSVRIKKNKTDTCKALKNALEREERLLNGGFNLHKLSSRNNLFDQPIDVLTKESHTSCSVVGAFKRQHSNFVICVNSLPRNMRAGSQTSFSLSPLTISLDEIPRPIIEPLPYYQRLYSEELMHNGAQFVTQQACKAEAVLILHRSIASHINTSIGVLFAMRSFKVEDEILLKNSESLIISKYKPVKKSFYMEPLTPPKTIDCVIESCEKIDLELPSNFDDQIEALEQAVERTEKVYFLEQNCDATYTVSETSTDTRDETFKNLEWDEESEKRKIHDLLVRTYNLQQKLHRHLKKLTDKPTSVSCPLIQKDTSIDFGAACRNSEVLVGAVDKSLEDAIVYWCFQTPQKSTALDEAVTVEVQKTDHATSYDPPPGQEKVVENAESGDDDRSSTYSFKSSNDFSEGEKELTAARQEENTRHVQFLKNIFNEIEIFKNRIMSEKNKERGADITKDEAQDWMEKRLTKPCEGIKTPTKLLKTVFKGKKSMTELSLGLKTVPLAKVSNISVEKRKISENHTKISICISKEKANDFPQDRTTSNEMMRSRLSHYLDSIRPSLSSSHSDFSKLENEICRAESEDDEDEFKSVMSTLSRPHSETNLVNEPKEPKKVETTPSKSFTKHRFDFYQKMNSSKKIRQKSMSNTSCTYKEFEPLRQALTEMQIRMRSIKRDAYVTSNDYYQRALKLAKMSAGYCQSCGSRSVIPQDTFGYYSTLLPRNQSHRHRGRHVKITPPQSSYYSLRSNVAELSDQFRDINLRESSSYLMNSSRTIVRNSLNDIPIYPGTI